MLSDCGELKSNEARQSQKAHVAPQVVKDALLSINIYKNQYITKLRRIAPQCGVLRHAVRRMLRSANGFLPADRKVTRQKSKAIRISLWPLDLMRLIESTKAGERFSTTNGTADRTFQTT